MTARVLHRTMIETPLGPMLTVASEDGLCGLEFDRPERATRLWARLSRWMPGHVVEEGHAPVFPDTTAWLQDYFGGHSPAPERLRLQLAGTPFEQAVWQALMAIAPGETMSYGGVARLLDRPLASRAVGAAVGANPVSIVVPCHRVIGTSGSLTGYGGGMERKVWLLRHEGALTGSALLPIGAPLWADERR